jgi:glucose-fructose oxidoreductase
MCGATVGGSIAHVPDAGLSRTVRTAEVLTSRFHALSDDRHFAMHASWRECLDRALERVEHVRGSADRDLERFVVRVATAFTCLHEASRLQGTCRMSRATNRIRMAVIGQGHFAQAAVLPAIEQLVDVELTALVSGSDHKLDELGDRYGVRTRCHYDQLDELLATGDVDAVYIAVPNDLHAEIALVAARHHVHVMCEKPMAPTEAECMQMIRACERADVKLMVAYRLHFEAANLIAVELARGGEIGAPRVFSSVFSMQVRDGNVRTQPRRGAGPIYDIGIYCVNAARYLFRAEPLEVSAMKLAGRDHRFVSVDEAFAVTMRFPEERVAQFTCSFGAHDRAHYQVIGTEGYLMLENAYEYAAEMKLDVVGRGGTKSRTFTKRDQIAAEIEYFAECIREDRDPEPSGWEGLADIRIIQAILASARFGRAVPIDPVVQHRRPDLGQEIRVDAHEMPKLVDVEQPTK